MRNSGPGLALLSTAVALMIGLLAVPPAAAAGTKDPALSDLVATLLPSVVNIYVTTYKEIQVVEGKPVMVQDAEPDKRHSFGSGFIVTPDGTVVTNKHVTHNAINIYVTLSDGRRLPADLIAEAMSNDIAVIKIRTDKPLPPVTLGDSNTVRQGDLVIAVGNSLGFTSTVSTGIISALNRDMGFTQFDNYMQTDAAINHGNSGGPLFNAAGAVIGVNSAIYTTGSETGNVGIGLAIPINDAKFVVNHLGEMRPGKAKLGYLGAQVLSLTADLAVTYGLPGPWGSIIVDVLEDSPAAQASLRAGDIITSFDGKDVNDSRALLRAIVETTPETTVALGVWRDGKAEKVSITVTDLPANRVVRNISGWGGCGQTQFSSDDLRQFRLENGGGHPRAPHQVQSRCAAAGRGGHRCCDGQRGSRQHHQSGSSDRAGARHRSRLARRCAHCRGQRTLAETPVRANVAIGAYGAPLGVVSAQLMFRKSLRAKYLNNLIEQDHRSVKQRIAVMLGLKQFRNAVITIAGIELMHYIRKGQFGLRRLNYQRRTAPAVWNAVLQA